ncbi:MAG: methylenetetrahydrofolate reductase C-terminal domain-containing protein [Elusimicrobia bacterium]|nr:methylenetetrahydrofolate reductase C-terminal domain-containing protein [Elusimicrobiota bacterium]
MKATCGAQALFIVGCGGCAKKCATGDEAAILALSDSLKKAGKIVLGTVIVDSACDMRLLKRDLLKNEAFLKSDKAVVLACGAGAGALSALTDKKIVTGLNSKYLGTVERANITHKFCGVCAQECVLNETAGICPKTRCSKGLISGSCGGYANGKCEADIMKDCAWCLIYNKRK